MFVLICMCYAYPRYHMFVLICMCYGRPLYHVFVLICMCCGRPRCGFAWEFILVLMWIAKLPNLPQVVEKHMSVSFTSWAIVTVGNHLQLGYELAMFNIYNISFQCSSAPVYKRSFVFPF